MIQKKATVYPWTPVADSEGTVLLELCQVLVIVCKEEQQTRNLPLFTPPLQCETQSWSLHLGALPSTLEGANAPLH